MRLALHFYLHSVIFESFQPILKYPYIPAAKADGIFFTCNHRRAARVSIFFTDIVDMWQQLPHFLRTSLTHGNSFRIFCGHRRHVATASAFFADIVDTWQQFPHFLRTSSTHGNDYLHFF